MTYSVNVSAQAENDIRAIYEYIALSLMSPENAGSQLSRLEKQIESLEHFPKRFSVYKGDTRFMPVHHYLVFYSVNEDSKTVSVFRVMYGKRDIENLSI